MNHIRTKLIAQNMTPKSLGRCLICPIFFMMFFAGSCEHDVHVDDLKEQAENFRQTLNDFPEDLVTNLYPLVGSTMSRFERLIALEAWPESG